jgi:hypothetical protein
MTQIKTGCGFCQKSMQENGGISRFNLQEYFPFISQSLL